MEKILMILVLWLIFGCSFAKLSDDLSLPEPRKSGPVSVEEAIAKRRTVRDFAQKAVTAEQLSTLCWAAQGITDPRGFKRAAPSAGALYPIFVYVAVGEGMVEGVPAGVYKYIPKGHQLQKVAEGDKRLAISRASLEQTWMSRASINFIISADYGVITPKYRQRGIQYANFEAGHVAENIMLEAVALGLAAGIVGAFSDEAVAKQAGINESEIPMLVLPVGHEK